MTANRKPRPSLILALIFGAALGAHAQQDAAPTPTPPPKITSKAQALIETDALLAKLAAATEDMRRFVSAAQNPGSADQACREHFTLNMLTGDYLPDSLWADVAAYHQCRAYVDKNPLACVALEQYHYTTPRPGLTDICRTSNTLLLAARSIISHAPDAADRCLDWVARPGRPSRFPAETIRKACMLIAGREDSHAVAPQVAELLKTGPDETADLEAHIGELKGEASACGKIGNGKPDQRTAQECMGIAAYRKAAAAQDASLCGGSWQCRMMMSAQGNCDAVSKKIAEAYCRSAKPRQYPQMFLRKKADADALVMNLSMRLGGVNLPGNSGLKSRRERFVKLRTELQGYMHEFHLGEGPKRAAKPNRSDGQ